MADDYSPPKVNKKGLLDKPHPIRTRGDVNRARVLPNVDPSAAGMSRPEQPHLRLPAKDDEMAARKPVSERPVSGFDYVKKRNTLMRDISGRR